MGKTRPAYDIRARCQIPVVQFRFLSPNVAVRLQCRAVYETRLVSILVPSYDLSRVQSLYTPDFQMRFARPASLCFRTFDSSSDSCCCIIQETEVGFNLDDDDRVVFTGSDETSSGIRNSNKAGYYSVLLSYDKFSFQFYQKTTIIITVTKNNFTQLTVVLMHLQQWCTSTWLVSTRKQ